MSLLDRIAETTTAPTCSCGDFARALALVLHVLDDEGIYRSGYRNGRADLLAAQLHARQDRYDTSRANDRRWRDNARRAWLNDCICDGCAGIPLDGWCRCTRCQALGWAGEPIIRFGHDELKKTTTKEVGR
ncbi:hypothetical protein ACSBQY_10435 [Micrococcus lylae]|uniref:hypothetical protein n=1 Tax=Micrococcus lylae TaxID=1273 RepID=UPI003EBBD46D